MSCGSYGGSLSFVSAQAAIEHELGLEGSRFDGKGLKRKVCQEQEDEVTTVSCESEVLGGTYNSVGEEVVLVLAARKKKKKQGLERGCSSGSKFEIVEDGSKFRVVDEGGSNFRTVDEDGSTMTTEDHLRRRHQLGRHDLFLPRNGGSVPEEEFVSSGDEFMDCCEQGEEAGTSLSIVDVGLDDNDEEEVEVRHSTYILSSGRKTYQVEKKIPTIDDEFEEYFRQLML